MAIRAWGADRAERQLRRRLRWQHPPTPCASGWRTQTRSSIPPPPRPACRWSTSARRPGATGFGGATMASASFEADSDEMRPTVQVGDPFAEKLLIEATLVLMASGAVAAIQGLGAAGLTSSSVEMAGKGGVGITLDLDQVPQREEDMTAYEMMLSESQERMLAILKTRARGRRATHLRKVGAGRGRDRPDNRHRLDRAAPSRRGGLRTAAWPADRRRAALRPAVARHSTTPAAHACAGPAALRLQRCGSDADELPRHGLQRCSSSSTTAT